MRKKKWHRQLIKKSVERLQRRLLERSPTALGSPNLQTILLFSLPSPTLFTPYYAPFPLSHPHPISSPSFSYPIPLPSPFTPILLTSPPILFRCYPPLVYTCTIPFRIFCHSNQPRTPTCLPALSFIPSQFIPPRSNSYPT